jgi:MFS family permease
MQTTDEYIQKKNVGVKTHSMSTAWLIWGCSAIFVIFQFFLQLSSGVIVQDLMQSFAINALGAGILSSTYYYVYVILQTPAGILIDRYGPRRLLMGGALFCAVGCWLFATAKPLAMAELGRLFMGAGSSFAFVGSLFIISQWFPAERFALMVGIAETIGMVGSLFGNIFLASLLHDFGWRNCMMGAAILAALISIICGLFIRDRPKNQLAINQAAITNDTHFFQSAWTLLKNPNAWFNGLYSGLLFSLVTVFVALWGIPFLVKVHDMSITFATVIVSSMFFGLALGCPIVGLLCARIKNRRRFLVISALLCAGLLSVLLYDTNLSILSTIIIMLLIGFFSSSYVINFAIANEIAPPNATSTSIGFTNALSVITAPLIQPLVGGLLHLSHKWHAPTAGTEYTVFDYQIALGLLPFGLLVAAVLAYLMDYTSKG